MLFRSFVSLFAIAAFAVSSQAGVINSLFNGEVTKLEDVDYEVALDGGDNSLDVGDYLLAIVEFGTTRLAASNDLVFNASASTDAITGVSLVKVVGVSQIIPGFDGILSYALAGVTSAEWTALTGLVGIGDGTALVAYHDPISSPAEHIVNSPTVAAGIASATNGTKIFEFAVDHFFTAQAQDLVGGTFNAYNISNIEDLTTVGDFVSTFNAFPGVVLLEHDFLNFGLGGSELQLNGGLESQGGSGAFDIVTDTDIYIFAVPEPSTGLAFAAIALVGGLVRRRRNAC